MTALKTRSAPSSDQKLVTEMEEGGDLLTWWVVTCLSVSWLLLAVTSISLWSLCITHLSGSGSGGVLHISYYQRTL